MRLVIVLGLLAARIGAEPAAPERGEAGSASREEANREYQLGRQAFEAGDIAKAEPHFLKAAEYAPQFPEPHYALAQIMVRQGRHQEAQQHMARAQSFMPPGPQSPPEQATPSDDGTVSLAVLAAKASASLPASHIAVGRALSHIAGYLGEGERAIAAMAASSDPQDVHNARIHQSQHVSVEETFRKLANAPTDANLWWQLALHSFNQRRDHMTASTAFAVTATLSKAPMVVMSFYLLFHAWQHLCDWRDSESRLRQLEARIRISLGDTPLGAIGPGGQQQWAVSKRAALPGGEGSGEGGGGEDGGGNWLSFGWGKPGGGKGKGAAGVDGSVADGADGGDGGGDGGEDAKSRREFESLVLAMESPYIFLVTRLVDREPTLIRRLFARQAALLHRDLDPIPPPPPQLPPSSPPQHGGGDAPSGYIRDGRLGVGYLSGLPAGHVTYNLVGSMLRFHTDPRLKVHWCTAAADPATVKDGVGGGLKQHWPHVIELNGLTPAQAAARLREAGIGVLIDLDGWIGDEPPRRLMALNPAPVRGHWLGWAGTTGDPSMQFMVTDGITSPVHAYSAGYYSERFVVLPRAYQLNDHVQLYKHVIAQPPRAAAAPRLPRARAPFVLANFNQLMKVAPDLFGVWTGAMRRTPRTELLLLTGVTNVHVQYPSAARNADSEIAMVGLRVQRLRKGRVRAKEAHLERAARCDLAVDTLSYNSHTTGSDALWSGLPMLTQSGRYFASRVAGALVSSAGVPQMQVASLKAYEDMIHHLATPNDRSDQPRERLEIPADPAPSEDEEEEPEADPDATLAAPFGGKWGAKAAKIIHGTHEMFFEDPARVKKASDGTSSPGGPSRGHQVRLGDDMYASKASDSASDDPDSKGRVEIPAENLLGPRRWGKTMHYAMVSSAEAPRVHEMNEARAFFKLVKGPIPEHDPIDWAATMRGDDKRKRR